MNKEDGSLDYIKYVIAMLLSKAIEKPRHKDEDFLWLTTIEQVITSIKSDLANA